MVGLLVTKGALASILTQLLTSFGPVEGAELTSKDAKGFGAIHWAVQSHKVTQAGPRGGSSRSSAQTLNQTPTMKEASERMLRENCHKMSVEIVGKKKSKNAFLSICFISIKLASICENNSCECNNFKYA